MNFKSNEANKQILTPLFNFSKESDRERVIIENNKRPLSFSIDFSNQVNNYQTPFDSPLFSLLQPKLNR